MTYAITLPALAAGVLHAPVPIDLPAMTDAVYTGINDTRAAHGLPALAWHPGVATIAQIRTIDIAIGAFTHHDNQHRLVFWDMLRDAGYLNYEETGEVLAKSIAPPTESPRHALHMWTRSPAHSAVLLSPLLVSVGIGAYVDDGMTYYAAVFLSEVPQ